MSTTQAGVRTRNGSKYLQQLCKHWSHKFPVEFTPERGRIDLGEGRICTMEALPEVLTVQATGDEAALPRLEGVIADHIKRFAFKEELAFVWERME